ncbi:MAG TPA: TylF/MycF/NovP-related O-methyltransferase [Hanamia sp.]|nr:TylF/MycF/NovP-related O-methyltransferase [Hanamia sp.]
MLEIFSKGMNFLFGKAFHKKNIFIGSSLGYLDRERKIDRNYFDYIRLSTLELVSYEINRKNLEGSVAELGVYKGKFARYINQYFPKRSLYLFDTFEGFDNRDIVAEKENKFSTGDQDFSDTSVESVLKSMPYPEKCIPSKGFFPESAKNIDAAFVFVSIDADLYEPIYNGLVFFYPKLVTGGYIFIHDFNNDNYKGSRKAVEQFCLEQKISCLPLPDFGGSAIIIK